MLRVSYLDPLYGPDKRENALASESRRLRAGDFAGSLEIAKAASQADVRDAIVRAVLVVRAIKGPAVSAIEMIGRLPEDKRQDIFLESGLARVRDGD